MKYIREFILLITSLVLLIIIFELGLRFFFLFNVFNEPDKLYLGYSLIDNGSVINPEEVGRIFRISYEEGVFIEMIPNLNVTFVNKTLVTNSDGFRDSEFSREKKNNTIRVVGIGDSTMFGWGVEENERYMDVLESKLKKKYPQYDWDFMVLAAPGYNIEQERLILERYLDYEPDLVIYGLVFNDACTPSLIYWEKGFFEKTPYLFSLLDFKHRSSFWFVGYNAKVLSLEEACVNIPEEFSDYGGKIFYEKEVEKLLNLSDNFELIVFSANSPWKSEFISYDLVKNLTLEIFDEDEIIFFEEDYLLVEPLNFVVSEDDYHLNSKGHELAGEYLFYELESKGVISEIIRRHEAGL